MMTWLRYGIVIFPCIVNNLLQIFSSPDLVVVNAICVSAGADQDVILEDLVKILDSYKYTLPIIKIGITKEIQSTG